MAGRGPGTMPDGEGVQKSIQEKVESYFPEHATEAPVAAAPDGANPPPGITDLVGKVKTQFSEDGIPFVVPAKESITAILDNDVKALIALSQRLQSDLVTLAQDDWKITYGPKGGGSFARRDSRPPRIVLDAALEGYTEQTAQILAHEVGHALYPYQPDYSSENNYVNGALADEGEATLYNIRVQREILASSRRDIGVAGVRDADELEFYNKTYDALDSHTITAEKARHDIGQTYRYKITSTTGKTYDEMHRTWYIEEYMPWLKKVDESRRIVQGIQS